MTARQPRLALPHGGWARPWLVTDAAALVLGHRDPLVQHYALEVVDRLAIAEQAINDWTRGWFEGTDAAWAITTPGDGVVGSLRFRLTEPEVGTARVGYWLDAEGRGRGWASTALDAASRTVFERLGWHRVELLHAVENDRSCAVARRACFTPEGQLRQAVRYADGRWSDEHLHARLADDSFPADRREE